MKPKGVEGQAFKGSAPVASPPSTERSESENETRSLTSSIPIIEYIDMTPTWEGILPTWIAIVDNCGFTEEATTELFRMARTADRWNQHCKEMKS